MHLLTSILLVFARAQEWKRQDGRSDNRWEFSKSISRRHLQLLHATRAPTSLCIDSIDCKGCSSHQSKLHKLQSGQYISFEGHFKAVKQQFQMAFRAWQKMKMQSVWINIWPQYVVYLDALTRVYIMIKAKRMKILKGLSFFASTSLQ